MKVCLLVLCLLGTCFASPTKRNVATMLGDLIDEIGLKDLLPWFKEVIQKDSDVDRVINYFKGDSWANIKNHLRQCPKYDQVKADMLKEGVDIVAILDKIKNFFSGQSRFQSRAPLGDWLTVFLEKLDIDEVVVIVKDKIENDVQMQKVVAFFQGDVYKGIKACMSQSQDVKDLVAILKKEGIDIERLIKTLKVLFESQAYAIVKHSVVRRGILDDVIEELKLKELLPWLQEKLENDPDAQKVVEFFESDDYTGIQEYVKKCPTYDNINKKMQENGIDLDDIMMKIKNFITGDTRRRRSLGDILEEFITEKLDLDHIMTYVKEKEKSDAKAKALLQYLRGKDLKDLETCANKSPLVQKMIQTLQDEDIDVPRLLAMVKTIFGVTY